MSSRISKLKTGGVAAALFGAFVAALLLSGCGGSGPDQATAEGSSTTQGTSGYIVKGDDKVTQDEGVEEIQSAKFPNGHDTDEVSVTGHKPVKPCSLVTRRQANGILGGNVKVSEHLQGPTCVYTGSGREITMVVTEVPLTPLVKGASSAKALTIGGHRAWCVRYGTTSVVASVGKDRVLQIAGPCQAGVRFAALAIPKITAG
jgi:hypothetical protein